MNLTKPTSTSTTTTVNVEFLDGSTTVVGTYASGKVTYKMGGQSLTNKYADFVPTTALGTASNAETAFEDTTTTGSSGTTGSTLTLTTGLDNKTGSLFTAGVALWLVYGVILGAWPIIIANTITLLLAGAVLVLKVMNK